MERTIIVLLSVLLVAVVGLGVITWRADQRAEDRAATAECLARVQATASAGLLAPERQIDEDGRVQAMQTLAAQIEDC
jgi:hypothetical protein